MIMKVLKSLAVEHPYYCSESNYYSNEARIRYETMTEFLDYFEGADVDMNLVFRWDIRLRGEGEDAEKAGRYCAEIFIMRQSKGIFTPVYVSHVNEVEAERFKKYAEKHWDALKDMWNPISCRKQ
jgi:hypothetical protein